MAYNSSNPTQSGGNNREQRNIRYIDKDFASFKSSLVEFSKTYFPDSYTDFSPSSPGMMFMEMAAYVGDVLSFYQDNQIQETFAQYARQTPNLYQLANMLGYKPKATGAACAEVTVFCIVPANSEQPDLRYAPIIPANTVINSSVNGQSSFVTTEFVDFTVDNYLNPIIYEVSDGSPQSFLLQKKVKAISAEKATAEFTFGAYEKFPTVILQDKNIVNIISCTDNNGNKWYEVPYLGQETIFTPLRNPTKNEAAPYLLKLLRTQRRFATKFIAKDQLEIQFGAGNAQITDADVVPDPASIGDNGANLRALEAFAPDNYTFTNTYGTAPAKQTLTFTYLKGGGIGSNAAAGTLTNIDTSGVTFPDLSNNDVLNSIGCTNDYAATGGNSGDTPDQIRENSLRMYGTQMRSVTQDDYTVRALSMPGVYGTIGKVYVEPEKIENLNPHARPAVLDMYVLAYDSDKKLVTANSELKTNLSTYLDQYRMINDTVKIKDGFVVNIGINFSIVARPNYAGNLVLTQCIEALTDYFSIEKWQMNQPIFLTDIYTLLDRIEGVQTVKSVEAINKQGGEYSEFYYDVKGATQNNTVYPSKDPSIFEVKFPSKDIKGSITNF
jgi:hypothetical protein